MNSSASSSGARDVRPFESRFNRYRRKFLSFLACSGSVSSTRAQMDDHMDESLAGSFEKLVPRDSVSTNSKQPLSSTCDSETGFSSSSTDTTASSGCCNEDVSPERGLSYRSADVELCSQQVNVGGVLLEDPAATEASAREPAAMTSVSTNTTVATVASTVDQGNGSMSSDGEPLGDGSREPFAANSDSDGSNSRLTSQPLPGLVLSDDEQDRIGASMLFLDVVSIRSNILTSNPSEINSREARRNGRRMFRDAFSRSSRSIDSPTIIFATSHADALGSHDRWLLDFSSDLHHDGVDRDSWHSSFRGRHRRQRRWQSRYGDSERFNDVHGRQSWQTSLCTSGLHPRGTCSCDFSSSTDEQSRSGSSISQIIMLADALFEVLEEIHRHRISFSPSTLSLPAPEAVVDSFPLKDHKKSSETESGFHDVQQCHICLVDYEEGDKIRVLPCSHQYHMLCVDKWLKEIHGVCPLCRDDVCKGANEGSASN